MKTYIEIEYIAFQPVAKRMDTSELNAKQLLNAARCLCGIKEYRTFGPFTDHAISVAEDVMYFIK